jgi:drug/metabolite transporter (DMT)-like permease
MEWATVILTVLLSAIMLPFAKGYQTSGSVVYLILGFLTWVGIFWGYVKLLGSGGMSRIYPLIKMLAIILVVIFGVFAYGEKLTLLPGIGIFLGIISVYLTSLGE